MDKWVSYKVVVFMWVWYKVRVTESPRRKRVVLHTAFGEIHQSELSQLNTIAEKTLMEVKVLSVGKAEDLNLLDSHIEWTVTICK